MINNFAVFRFGKQNVPLEHLNDKPRKIFIIDQNFFCTNVSLTNRYTPTSKDR